MRTCVIWLLLADATLVVFLICSLQRPLLILCYFVNVLASVPTRGCCSLLTEPVEYAGVEPVNPLRITTKAANHAVVALAGIPVSSPSLKSLTQVANPDGDCLSRYRTPFHHSWG